MAWSTPTTRTAGYTVPHTEWNQNVVDNPQAIYDAHAWTDVAFSAGNFTSDSGSWTVASGDVDYFAYRVLNKTMSISFRIVGSTVSGSPNQLRIAIPASATSAGGPTTICRAIDNGTDRFGVLSTAIGFQYVYILAISFATATNVTWANATDTTSVWGQIEIEIA